MTNNNQHNPFLAGGGEMGELTRNKDWSHTPVGKPETWPQSLKTTLGILLNSRFPMFLWWGPELTCFYNDAYRPSLGQEGKHPSILGLSAQEAWPEIWHIIHPLIQQVLNGGEATWSEDQLIPIFRNGKLEDVYWTFSYSPVYNDSGNIGGVLVTCNETTEKVLTLKKMAESEKRFRTMAEGSDILIALSDESGKAVYFNNAWAELTGKSTEQLLDFGWTNLIHEEDRQEFLALYLGAFDRKESWTGEFRMLNKHGNYSWLLIRGAPRLGEDGYFAGYISSSIDITHRKESENRFRDIVFQAPMGITILRGPEFWVEMANETLLNIVARDFGQFVGKPLFDSMPELKEIGTAVLGGVLESGLPFNASDFPAPILRNGKEELSYFNVVCHPIRENKQTISGIIVVATEVTAAVLARQNLLEREKQFRNLVNLSPVGMAIFKGKDQIIEMANNVMLEKIWRKEHRDITGKRVVDVFPEMVEQRFPDLLDQVLETGNLYSESESLVYLDGPDGMRKFYLDFQFTPLLDQDNIPSGIVVTANDVTEKVEARLKIEENENHLNIVIEASELGTWELNIKTGEVQYSDRYLEIIGYTPPITLSHAEIVKHLHPDDLLIRKAAFENAFETGVLDYASRLIWNDGSIHWIEGKGKVFYDEEGKPEKMIGTVRDITDEKNFQQQLQEREQKFSLLAETIPHFVWTGDAEGHLNYFNKAVYDYSGLSMEEVMANGWIQIVHPDEREENIRVWKQAISSGRDFFFEHRFRRHDGVYRWQLSRAVPQKDAAGNIQMWVGTSTDVHDHKMFTQELEKQVLERTSLLQDANQKLENSIQELQKMNSELQSFAYVSSHDLQEPLRKIRTFVGRILEKEHANLTETGKDYFRRMEDAALRMQTLIEDLLAYSRTNTSDHNFKHSDLGEIINEVKSEFKETIAEKHAVVELGQLCPANVIPFQFRQLMHNLLGNSLKFSKPDVTPHIKIESRIEPGATLGQDRLDPQKNYCHILFSDNGIGFEPQYSERIFEVFQRLHGKNEYRGTGIGLAIVKKIVENHSGLILAKGEPGKGAQFDIYLPAE